MSYTDIVESMLCLSILSWPWLKRFFTPKSMVILALGGSALYQLLSH